MGYGFDTKSLEWPTIFGVICWVFSSNLTILFNKWLINSTEFHYPIILTCWQLAFATIVTQILAKTTTILNSRKNVKMTPRLYFRTMVPISICYCGSLVCSNIVYLYLNISFIQMLKAAGPVITLFISWAWRVKKPSMSVFINILVIAFSVGLAASGEIQFSWIGLVYQLAGLVFDANRLVMVQILLSGDGQNMDPLVSLYYSAPACAALNFIIAWYMEIPSFDWGVVARTGYGVLILNALTGFMLNISIFFLIRKTSSLAMTLISIPKNILLIVASVMIWHTSINRIQVIGYTIALLGLLHYSLGWETVKAKLEATWERFSGRNKMESEILLTEHV